MYKILIIADVRGWAYDKRAQALKKYAPDSFDVDITYVHEVPNDMSMYDLVFNIDYSQTANIKQKLRNQSAKAKLVVSHNADHQRAHSQLETSLLMADFVVMNNRAAWEHNGRAKKTCNISNGVDLDIFHRIVPWSDRKERAVWVGNAGKGLNDILLPLQKACPHIEFEFKVKTGKEWDPVTHLPNSDIWSSEEMAQWYNIARYVICCSETEGTPNYLLEAMACGCVPVTTNVGNVPEFLTKTATKIVPRDLRSFIEFFRNPPLDASIRSGNAEYEIELHWSWEQRAKLYFLLFASLIEGDKITPFTYMDIENDHLAHF